MDSYEWQEIADNMAHERSECECGNPDCPAPNDAEYHDGEYGTQRDYLGWI